MCLTPSPDPCAGEACAPAEGGLPACRPAGPAARPRGEQGQARAGQGHGAPAGRGAARQAHPQADQPEQ